MLEFPEVFHALRPDPLDTNRIDHAAWMDSFIGNPPFMGKNSMAGALGPIQMQWIQFMHSAHGNADYVAHFFRRAAFLLGAHGTIGFVATKTIAQGDTRATGLQALIMGGCRIYDAIPMMRWPGERDAAVSIATVHIAKGVLSDVPGLVCVFGGRPVSSINSRLRSGKEMPDPVPLLANRSASFQGSIVLGMGFTMTRAEREELVRLSPSNGQRILPYVGGEEVNNRPNSEPERYVISFGDMSLEEARRWPELLESNRSWAA